jgi:signal peptide peptidase SppA
MKYARIIAEFESHIWALREETLLRMQELIRYQAAGMKWTPEEIRDRIAEANAASGYLGHEALEARYIVAQDKADDAYEDLPHLPMMGAGGKRNAAAPGSVALIPMTGIISHRMSMMSEISGSGGGSIQALTAQFRQALQDGNCKAIVFDVDSPGGSVEGVMELAQEIYDARKVKPVTAVSNAMACSAAYWLASAASEVVCTPSGQCGSIGVYMVHQDMSKALENEGVKVTIIKAGKYKAEGSSSQPLSDEAQAYLQSQVDSVNSSFIKAVAQHRGTSQAAVRDGFGQGRSLLAGDAVKAGLADRVGTLDSVLEKYGVKKPGGSGARAEGTDPTLAAAAKAEDDDQTFCDCSCEPCKGCTGTAAKAKGDDMSCSCPCGACKACAKATAAAQAANAALAAQRRRRMLAV